MFNGDFFKGNRERLCTVIPDSYVFVSANGMLQRSADTTFQFRQDSSFWYLTGLEEPDLVLGINTKSGETTIFVPKQNDYQKEWDGQLNKLEMKKTSGIDNIALRSNLNKILKEAKKDGLRISYLRAPNVVVQPYGFYSNPARKKLETEIKEVEPEPKDVSLEIARLRQIKQPIELRALQKAIDITGHTLDDVKSKLGKFKNEKEVERAISSGFFGFGADGHGFDPIVASGKSAATIHYTANCNKVAISDLLLLDVGATVGYYSADISRTWAIGGKESKRQKDVHDAVLDLQKQAFLILKPGIMLKDYQDTMDKNAIEAYKKLGVKLERFPHGFSHFLGLDVHDVGDYDMPLTENCVLTVEPGIYLPSESIGVRVEDVVRITKDGIEIMSKNIPQSL